MKLAEYNQQLRHLKMDLQDIYKELDQRPIKRYVAIIHDKDVLPNGEPKEPHIHIMMELSSNQDIDNIAKWFNDQPQYIEKAKTKGKFAYNNMVSYALHLTDTSIEDGKYKYPLDECKSNFDLSKLIQVITNDVNEAKEKSAKLKNVINDIIENKIPHHKLGEYLTNEEWHENYSKIEVAYKIRNEKIKNKMEEDKVMNVIYLTGSTGTGKTTYAKLMSKALGYNFYVTSSGQDPLGEYDGQECVIVDDLRKENFSYAELLKLTDNNTHSFVKSRYNNKCPYNCKYLFITSVLRPQDLVYSYELDSQDSIDQFYRRINTLAIFNDNKDYIELFEYDNNKNEFVFVNKTENPLKKVLSIKQKYPKVSNTLINMTAKITSNIMEDKVKKFEEMGFDIEDKIDNDLNQKKEK